MLSEISLRPGSSSHDNFGQVNWPYPGKQAEFVAHGRGSWEPYDYEDEFGTKIPQCRELRFRSEGEDSIIQEFSICGYRDGSVTIFIYVRTDYRSDNEQRFMDYLLTYGITSTDLDFHIRSKNHAELKTLYKIVSENNKIPEKYLTQISDIVNKGTCEPF